MKQVLLDDLDLNAKDILLISDTVTEVLKRIELYKIKTFYVIDDQKKFIGVVSDGDIRRHFIEGCGVNTQLNRFVNTEPKYYTLSELETLKIPKLLNSVTRLPVLNDMNLLIGFFPKSAKSEDFGQRTSALAIAPTRISFAGGGSDVNYWFDKNEGCVVNAAIQKYARVKITRNFTNEVKISSFNTGRNLTLNIKKIADYKGTDLNIIVQCLNACGVRDGLDVDVFCDYSPGTGLGGSSSLVVATLMAISRVYNFQLNTRELVDLSFYVERSS